MSKKISFCGEPYAGHRPDSAGRQQVVTIYPTNYGDMSAKELAELSGINLNTLKTRIGRYGLDASLVLSKQAIPQGHEFGSKLFKEKRLNRKRCRRGGINCTKYSECQLQRCGIGPRWVDPGDTDRCYVEPKIIRNLYPSALAAMSHFGVVGY